MGKHTPIAHSVAKREFALRLKAVRISAGYPTQKEFAAALGSEDETYRRWERGETEPNVYYLQRIATVTGVSLDFLISGNLGATKTPSPDKRSSASR